MTELGPFRVNPDGKTLSRNRHAWNNVANVLFLESPAGVGFSYSNTSSDYVVGDERTAVDSYIFLLHWLERFPEYKGRDFYIAGESYAGHYIPELAAVIVADPTSLKGIFIGNALLDYQNNDKGSLEFLWNHGVMSDEIWANITKHCSFGPSDGTSSSCDAATTAFYFNFAKIVGNIDVHNIYAPMCIQAPNGTVYSSSYLPGYDPCINNYVTNYFNSLDVQEAIHVRINTRWSNCSMQVYGNWKKPPLTMVPTLSSLVDTGLRVWLYSGDMDDVCPITATRYSVHDLNLTITKPWRPWYTPANEVGGYIQQHEGGFTFASVRGAGHMVPSFQPKRSLVLFYSFLKGVLPPAVSLWQP
ncbi:serine carboxypeptidase II-3-like [Panicum hallii]|nr:serine carboxypeptidase II-3-like [Panicum hallii]